VFTDQFTDLLEKNRKLPRLLSHSNTANFSSYRGNYRGYLGITEFLITVSVSTVESILSDLEGGRNGPILPRDAMRKRGLSVRPSVCPSVRHVRAFYPDG